MTNRPKTLVSGQKPTQGVEDSCIPKESELLLKQRNETYVPHYAIGISNSVIFRFAQNQGGQPRVTIQEAVLGATSA